MKILILNGPNLNLIGVREPEIYGRTTLEDYFKTLRPKFPTVEFEFFQSNHEGVLLDKLHEVGFSYDGIVCNLGAYSHTSIALADAIAGITTPVVEVHISNVHARESFRHHSYLTKNCVGMIAGLGLKGYELGVRYFVD